jgi:hypothetical protein
MQKDEKLNYYIQYMVRGPFLTWSVACLSFCILLWVKSTCLIMNDVSWPIIPLKKIYSEDTPTNTRRNDLICGCMHVQAEQISDIRFSWHVIENQIRINLNFGNSPSIGLECLITFSCGATAKNPPRSPYYCGFYIAHTHTYTHTHTHVHTHTHIHTDTHTQPAGPLNEWSDRRSGRYLYTAQHDEFETAIQALKRFQIYPLDGTATGIDIWLCASWYSNPRSHYVKVFKEVLPL